MKKKLTRFLSASLMLLFPLAAQAYDFSAVSPSGHTLYYSIRNAYGRDYALLTFPNASATVWADVWNGYTKPSGHVIIPNTVTHGGVEYPVWNIYGAFYQCTELNSVTLPDSLLQAGIYSFYGCTGLVSIQLPDSLRYISNSAFWGCTGLTSVNIPDRVQSIGNFAFSQDSNLASIRLGRSLTYIGRGAFHSCAFSNITIPDGVTVIDTAAFYGNRNLRSITIPRQITDIKQYAFSHCTGLDTIVWLADSCKIENNNAFGYYDYVDRSVYISEMTVGEHVRYISTPLQFLRVSTMNYNSVNCRSRILDDNRGLRVLHIADGVEFLPSSAFEKADISSVALPASLTSIGSSAFSGCSNLSSVTIPSGITHIYDRTFEGCSGLTSITIPNGVTYISDKAFNGCSLLASVAIPNSVTYLGENVFGGCTSLATAEIGNGVDALPKNLFQGCNHLTNLTIGSGVTQISPTAFSGCTAVLRMTVKAEVPPSATSNPFTEFNTGIPVSVPCGSLSAYQNAAYWGFFTNYQGQAYAFTAVSDNLQMGSVSIITAPDCTNLQAEVQANPYQGFRFVRWNDGNTQAHRYIVVTSDTSLVAYFESTTGIDQPDSPDFNVSVEAGVVTVEGTDGHAVRLYDTAGRMVASSAAVSGVARLAAPCAGVYLLRVGDAPASKVVVR